VSQSLRGSFGSYARVLAKRDVRYLFAGLTVSSIGSWAYRAGLVTYVYSRTHSLPWVGIAVLCRLLPQLLVSPYGGVIADRSDKIKVLIRANALCALWQSCLVVIVAFHEPVWLALVFMAISGGTNCTQAPTVGAAIPGLVGEQNLVAANALNATVDNVTIVAGPMVGALLFLLTGSAAAVFAFNAASFVIAGFLAMGINERLPAANPKHEPEAAWRDVAVGIRSVLDDPAVRTLVAFSVLVSFVSGTDVVLFVAVSAHKLGTGATGYAYLLTGFGIGGVLMASLVDRLAARPRLAAIIIVGVAGCCIPTALMVVIHTPALAVLVQIIRGASDLLVDVLAITAMQRTVARDQVGRVLGVFFAFVIGSTTLGSVVIPWISNGLGLNGALLAIAFAPVAVSLCGIPTLISVDRKAAISNLALAPRVALLEQLDLFSAASRPLLETLASESVDRDFPVGEPIVKQGDEADYLYVLLEGTVLVTKRRDESAPAMPISTITAPAYFGEIGIVEGIPRTATVTAKSACRCALISGDALLDALAVASASSSFLATSQSRLAFSHSSLSVPKIHPTM
jgi:MFS family permease